MKNNTQIEDEIQKMVNNNHTQITDEELLDACETYFTMGQFKKNQNHPITIRLGNVMEGGWSHKNKDGTWETSPISYVYCIILNYTESEEEYNMGNFVNKYSQDFFTIPVPDGITTVEEALEHIKPIVIEKANKRE